MSPKLLPFFGGEWNRSYHHDGLYSLWMSDRNFSSEADAGVMTKQVKSLYAQVITGMNNHFAELPNSQVTFRIEAIAEPGVSKAMVGTAPIDVGDDFLPHCRGTGGLVEHDDRCLIARQSACCPEVDLALWGGGIALGNHGDDPPAQWVNNVIS